MNKEFIPYEEALALKELGFDEPCFGYYNMVNHSGKFQFDTRIWENSDDYIEAPLYQQSFRWFRYKKIRSIVQEYDFNNYMFSIDDGINRDIEVIGYDTYEEAELECLKKLIEIVKNK